MTGKGLPPAMVIGGTFSALGVARNLGKFGVPVAVVDHEVCIARFSRYVQHAYNYHSDSDDLSLIRYLLELGKEQCLKDVVLFPSDDEGVRRLSQNREQLSQYYVLTTPPWEVVRYCYDKRASNQLAKELGIPIPETHNLGELSEPEIMSLEYPRVVKPAITPHLVSVTHKKGYRVDSGQELLQVREKLSAFMDLQEVLLQELIPGRTAGLYSYAGYFTEGQPVAALCGWRKRQHPMELGKASTYVETVTGLPLEAYSLKFLKQIRFTGLAEVEFMYDSRDNQYKFLEVNPRMWGWHTIAIKAGLDLPYYAYLGALGREPGPNQPPGTARWVRLVTDFPTVLGEISKNRLTPGRYLESLSGDIEYAVFSLDDPMPFVAELFLLPYFMIRKGF